MHVTTSFQCKEIDLKGKIIYTTYRAESKEELVQLIRAKGHTPVKVEKEEVRGQDVSQLELFNPRVKVKDVAIFCKQLHTMLAAGMPLITCLDVLANQADNRTLRATVKDMTIQVQKGEILSATMKPYPKVFPKLLINMVEAGELTGNLDSVLERMSEHYTKENKINSKIKGAMMYPMILSILAVTMVVFMLTFVMPTFMTMFTSSGVELPGPTRVLLAMSDAIQNYWYIFIIVIVGFIAFMRQLLKTTPGKRTFDRFKFKIPGLKTPIAKIATSRFTRTLSTLLASGIPIIQALESAATVTNNQVVIDGIGQVTEDIKKGSSLSLLLRKVGVFPPMMISMVGIGEESGALEEMLEKTADFYDEELDSAISRMIAILEPAMIVVMAVMIGFIVISMIMPMFDMFQTIS